jgi:hypothetical protein
VVSGLRGLSPTERIRHNAKQPPYAYGTVVRREVVWSAGRSITVVAMALGNGKGIVIAGLLGHRIVSVETDDWLAVAGTAK